MHETNKQTNKSIQQLNATTVKCQNLPTFQEVHVLQCSSSAEREREREGNEWGSAGRDNSLLVMCGTSTISSNIILWQIPSIRDAWVPEFGWIFGKLPKGGGGGHFRSQIFLVILRGKTMNFRKKHCLKTLKTRAEWYRKVRNPILILIH